MATATPVKLPEAYNIVYNPSGTFVNVKFILPLAPHIDGLLLTAERAGGRGAIIAVLTPADEVQPPAVISRLL